MLLTELHSPTERRPASESVVGNESPEHHRPSPPAASQPSAQPSTTASPATAATTAAAQSSPPTRAADVSIDEAHQAQV